jgi:Uma2 family endonuclease
MGTKTLMSVDEYLHTTFDGADREYLDGEVVERNMGNKSHGRLQLALAALLKTYEASTGIYVLVEVRQKVTSTRYRIPDIAVFEREPEEEVPPTPPLVAVEVLSPDDRASYLIPKLEEYGRWGVKHIWIVDPDNRKMHTYDGTGLHEVTELTIPEHGIALTQADVFSGR